MSQKDGTDLDPNFLKYKPRGEREGGGAPRITGANVAAVQAGTIDWGYLKGAPSPHLPGP